MFVFMARKVTTAGFWNKEQNTEACSLQRRAVDGTLTLPLL